MGTAAGVVQSWSDTQVVAQVAAGSTSGNAQILQGGVWSNAVAFTVNSLQLTDVSPTSGGPGASNTISGSGFGAVQGRGVVWLGSTAGNVITWTDTQIVAAVATTAVTGIARVQQNGSWSNATGFTVPASGGNALAPQLLNLVVGDTHTIQALNAAAQPVTGLTWTSSDPTVVSLSTDDPPVLTAVAAGHVTITAGTASADVTVSAGALALGTVLWSNNPVNGASVDLIVPAVPSPTGVADVFALSGSTVYAITSDGATAWTADLSDFGYPDLYPDFQGGLVVANLHQVVKLDGITGQRYAGYTAPDGCYLYRIAVHPDGTIFADQQFCNSTNDSVIGIDPTTGALKFQVTVPIAPGVTQGILGNPGILGTDGTFPGLAIRDRAVCPHFTPLYSSGHFSQRRRG